MKQVETNAVILVVFVALLASIGTFVTVVIPLADPTLSTPSEYASPYSALELRGKHIYQREGCWYCHTQQTRNLLTETKRYGMGEEETFKRFGVRTFVAAPPSQPGEFVHDKPHLLGTRRIGPDLSRVGGKYDNSWHVNHLRDPRSTSPGSIMPSYTWYFTPKGEPTEEAFALVAYLQKLGTNMPWRQDGVDRAQARSGDARRGARTRSSGDPEEQQGD